MFVRRQSFEGQCMDGAAHQVAERCIDHTMARQQGLADKLSRHHACFEMNTIIAVHFDKGVGHSGTDQITDFCGIHGMSSGNLRA